MKKIEIVKSVTSLVVSLGVAKVFSNIAKATASTCGNPIIKGCVYVGTFVVCSMVTDKADTYTDAKIDGTLDSIKQSVANEIKEK